MSEDNLLTGEELNFDDTYQLKERNGKTFYLGKLLNREKSYDQFHGTTALYNNVFKFQHMPDRKLLEHPINSHNNDRVFQVVDPESATSSQEVDPESATSSQEVVPGSATSSQVVVPGSATSSQEVDPEPATSSGVARAADRGLPPLVTLREDDTKKYKVETIYPGRPTYKLTNINNEEPEVVDEETLNREYKFLHTIQGGKRKSHKKKKSLKRKSLKRKSRKARKSHKRRR